MKLRMRASYEVYADSVSIYLKDGDFIGSEVVMKKYEEGQMTEPLLRIPHQAAQELINDLWNAGFRPEGAKDKSDQINVLNRHLEDMRQITFSKLNIDKP